MATSTVRSRGFCSVCMPLLRHCTRCGFRVSHLCGLAAWRVRSLPRNQCSRPFSAFSPGCPVGHACPPDAPQRSAKSRGANAGAGGGSAAGGDGPGAGSGSAVKQERSQRHSTRSTPRRSPRLQRKQAMGLLGTPIGGGSGRGGPGSTPEQWGHGTMRVGVPCHH